MKKLILIAACAAMFSVTAFAQDTTKTRQTPTQTPQQSDQMRDDMKGWTQLNSADVPANLRTTFGESQYTGWESGTVYRNTTGDGYMLRLSDKNNAGSTPKIYYFDKNGKVTKKPSTKG